MRKLLGALYSFCALGSAMFFTVFAVDLISGGRPETSTGVLAGLVVFFGGLAASSGFGAWRMLTTAGARARRAEAASGPAVDIALEARVLALAGKTQGRLTVAEVAVGCAVSLAEAERSLDGLTQRGHADLHITADGERVYVLAGFLSEQQKEQARDLVEVSRE